MAAATTRSRKTTATPRKRTTAPKRTPAVEVEPKRGRGGVVLLGALLVIAAVAVAIAAIRSDDESAAVSAEQLTTLVAERDDPVFWAGPAEGRELELTTTEDGTFVRYLPAGVGAGDEQRVLTVATYPVANAYATARSRSKAEGMVSRETRNGGLAVWSRTRPTSVYVAFAGVPQLVEVYSPDAAEARSLALSGRIRRVR